MLSFCLNTKCLESNSFLLLWRDWCTIIAIAGYFRYPVLAQQKVSGRVVGPFCIFWSVPVCHRVVVCFGQWDKFCRQSQCVYRSWHRNMENQQSYRRKGEWQCKVHDFLFGCKNVEKLRCVDVFWHNTGLFYEAGQGEQNPRNISTYQIWWQTNLHRVNDKEIWHGENLC